MSVGFGVLYINLFFYCGAVPRGVSVSTQCVGSSSASVMPMGYGLQNWTQFSWNYSDSALRHEQSRIFPFPFFFVGHSFGICKIWTLYGENVLLPPPRRV